MFARTCMFDQGSVSLHTHTLTNLRTLSPFCLSPPAHTHTRNSPNLEAMIANGAYMPNGAHGGYVPYIDGDINLGESTMQEDSVNTPLLAQQPVSYGGGDQPGNDNLDSDL